MKIRNLIFSIIFLSSAAVLSNDDIRIKANRCLNFAMDVKISESMFKKSLAELKAMCRTKEEKQYFEEFKILAETQYNARPLITAVTDFTCEDASLAMTIKPSAISGILETNLDESFTKVTRKDIDKAIEELNFQNSDLFDQKTSVKLGSFIGAQYIICGNIQKVVDEIVITAKVMEVKTGKIVKNGIIKLKNAGEVADAIPALAKQLSIKSGQKAKVSLSGYAIKYLNHANKKIAMDKYDEASADIMHSKMFQTGEISKNSLIPLQTFVTASTCHTSKRDYKSSLEAMNKSLDFAKDVFGETDEVTIHYHYNMAKNHLRSGNIANATAAYQNARKLFERTKEAREGNALPFAAFEQLINKRAKKEIFSFDKSKLEHENNTFIRNRFNSGLPEKKVILQPAPVKQVPEKKVVRTLISTAKVQPVVQQKVSPAAAVNTRSGELRAALMRLKQYSQKKQVSMMLKTAKTIEQKYPQDKEAKNIVDDYCKRCSKEADALIAAGKYNQAIDILVPLKDFIDTDTLRKLAMCCDKTGDIDRAVEYYTFLSSKKDAPSLFWLGRYCAKNNKIDDSLKYLNSAAEAGEAKAYLAAAAMYLSKRYGIYDESKGIEYMKKAAEAGVPAAQYNLGCCYANFPGARYACLPYDRMQAVKWLTKAKANGIKQAEKALHRVK